MDNRTAPIADRAAGPVPARTITEARRGAAAAIVLRGTANLAYAAILLFGGLTSSPLGISRALSDTTQHGLAYLMQTLLLYWLARAFLAPAPALASAAFGAASYGALVEFCQLLQPARSFEVRDLGANLAGVAVASAVVLIAGATARRR